jgi:hypothetical protein
MIRELKKDFAFYGQHTFRFVFFDALTPEFMSEVAEAILEEYGIPYLFVYRGIVFISMPGDRKNTIKETYEKVLDDVTKEQVAHVMQTQNLSKNEDSGTTIMH